MPTKTRDRSTGEALEGAPQDAALEQPTSDAAHDAQAPSGEGQTDPTPQSETPSPAVPLHTPREWGKKLGHFRAANPHAPQQSDHFDVPHSVANELHGWDLHAYHHQAKPFLISQADYEAALKAALEFPLVAPHAAALPESQRARFEDFKPRRKREKADR